MPFAPRHHKEAEQFCRELAAEIPWSTVILERWPAPVAFEYWRLRDELEHGQLLAAMFQLKDCAEVLVKLAISIAGRVLIEYGSARQKQSARQFLLARKPLSFGDWISEGVKLIDEARCLPPEDWQPWVSLFDLLRKAGRKNESTALQEALVDIVGWRNSELGHGALKLDLMDIADGLKERLEDFNRSLLKHEAAWTGITLAVAGADGTPTPLTGYAALNEAQSMLRELLADRSLAPLLLQRENETLWLGPYVCLRHHSREEMVGCYVLNKRVGKRNKALLNLLDYCTGDTGVVSRATGDETLTKELDSLSEEITAEGGEDSPVGDSHDQTVRDFLDGISFRREYVSPEYLRDALKGFIAAPERNRGLFWLCGPADVGKTLFSYGLATKGSVSEILDQRPAPLLDDLEVIVVPIRREYRCTPAALSSDVQYALGRSGDQHFLGLERFLYDAAYQGDKSAAFCAWLKRVRLESVGFGSSNARFMLVLDGLDELPQVETTVEGGSIADLLPLAQDLPERVFLLLTSRGRDPERPLDACPEAIYAAMEHAFAGSDSALRQCYNLDPLVNSDYRAVLQTFFEERLAGIYPSPAERAALFAQVLERSEHRFKSLSYFTALLASGAITSADVAELSATPLQEHLAALATWEPPRKFALMRRILLELAAAEQAHRAEIQFMEPAPVMDRQWFGLEVLELAERVGYPAFHPRELDSRFLTALYSAQELIRSYRGADALANRFALGLKGMVEQLTALDSVVTKYQAKGRGIGCGRPRERTRCFWRSGWRCRANV